MVPARNPPAVQKVTVLASEARSQMANAPSAKIGVYRFRRSFSLAPAWSTAPAGPGLRMRSRDHGSCPAPSIVGASLDDARHHAGADGAAALADGEAKLLLHGDRHDQLDRHRDVVPRHHH